MGLYALNLAVVMATLGFGLPYALNKLLRKKVDEDKTKQFVSAPNFIPEAYKKFELKKEG